MTMFYEWTFQRRLWKGEDGGNKRIDNFIANNNCRILIVSEKRKRNFPTDLNFSRSIVNTFQYYYQSRQSHTINLIMFLRNALVLQTITRILTGDNLSKFMQNEKKNTAQEFCKNIWNTVKNTFESIVGENIRFSANSKIWLALVKSIENSNFSLRWLKWKKMFRRTEVE